MASSRGISFSKLVVQLLGDIHKDPTQVNVVSVSPISGLPTMQSKIQVSLERVKRFLQKQ
jgi:hypothetical protein